jgi:hypothetical protein
MFEGSSQSTDLDVGIGSYGGVGEVGLAFEDTIACHQGLNTLLGAFEGLFMAVVSGSLRAALGDSQWRGCFLL